MTDLILLAIVLLALLWGWFAGGVRVLAGVGALVIAYQVARYYSSYWATYAIALFPQLEPGAEQGKLLDLISVFVDTDVLTNRVVQLLLFIVIFIVARWLIHKLASLVTGLLGGSILAIINRALGAVLAGLVFAAVLFFVHGVMLPAVADFGLGFIDTAQEFLDRSQFVLPLVYTLPRILGA